MELERPGFTESGFSQRKGDVIEDYGGGGGDFTQTSKFLEPEKIRNNKKSNTLEKDLKAAKGQISKLEKELNDAQAATAGVATTASTDSDELNKTKEELKKVKRELETMKKDREEALKVKDQFRDQAKQLQGKAEKLLKQKELLKKQVNELETQVNELLKTGLSKDVAAIPVSEDLVKKAKESSAPPLDKGGSTEERPTEKREKSKDSLTPTQRFKRTLLATNTFNLKKKDDN